MLKRIVVTGATGNGGTSVVRGLAADPLVGSAVGIARRRPEWTVDNVTWHTADLAEESRRHRGLAHSRLARGLLHPREVLPGTRARHRGTGQPQHARRPHAARIHVQASPDR
jgi:uncharacterized protein YbjT (DUF2867 family)